MELRKRLDHVESVHVYYGGVDSQLWAEALKLRVNNTQDNPLPKKTAQ